MNLRPAWLSLSRWLPLIKAGVAPAAIAALALWLRTYHLVLLGWIPDSYERIIATQRLLSLDFPLSRIYPPGVAIILAPAFAIFPQTLVTMQAVIIACGVALVLLAYFATIRLTGDRLAASLYALVIATDSAFVYASRDALFDTMVSLILGLAIFLLPLLRGRSLLVFVAYGFLLSLLVGIRPTNIACLPALLIYWVDREQGSFSPLAFIKTLLSRPVLITGATLVGLTCLYAIAGGWFGQVGGAQLTTSAFFDHIVFYESQMLHGLLGAVALTPLILAGTYRLWPANRPLTLAILWVLAIWPIVHAPFFFDSARYMLPARFFVPFLAALGVSELWRRVDPSWAIVIRRACVCFGLFLFGSLLVVSENSLMRDWPKIAAQSDEGMFREVRPVVAGLESNALIVSAVSRGLPRERSQGRYLDLIDLTIERGTTANGTADAEQAVQAAIEQGRPVYYLASRWEDGIDFQGGGRDSYDRYLDAIRGSFKLTELFRTTGLNLAQSTWILYQVEPSEPGIAPAAPAP